MCAYMHTCVCVWVCVGTIPSIVAWAPLRHLSQETLDDHKPSQRRCIHTPCKKEREKRERGEREREREREREEMRWDTSSMFTPFAITISYPLTAKENMIGIQSQNVTQYAHRLKTDNTHISISHCYDALDYPWNIWNLSPYTCTSRWYCIHKCRGVDEGWLQTVCARVRTEFWVLDHNRRFLKASWNDDSLCTFVEGSDTYIHLITALMVRSLTTESPQNDLAS